MSDPIITQGQIEELLDRWDAFWADIDWYEIGPREANNRTVRREDLRYSLQRAAGVFVSQ